MKQNKIQKVKKLCRQKCIQMMLFFSQMKYEIALSIIGGASTQMVYAADPKTTVITVLDKIVDIFPAIGIALALVGSFKMLMAFRNDQPDAYSGAAKEIAIGVVLIIFRAFIWGTIKGLS